MSVRLLFIGLMVFLGFCFTAIALWLRIRLKKSSVYGMRGAANNQTDTSKMKIGEIFLYILSIVITVLIVLKLMSVMGSGAAALGGMIIAIPVRAFFNARKRTYNAIFSLAVLALLIVFLCFGYILIGLPVKPPVMTVGGMKVTLSKTSVEDLLDGGFDVYIMNDEDTYEYSELLTSGSYIKYERNQDLKVEKGDRDRRETLRGASYLLVKDETVIGAIDLFGSLDKDVDIEDSKVINLYMDEDCVAAVKEKSINISFNNMDLLETLNTDTVRTIFKRKLWLIPEEYETTSSSYGIAWRTNSDDIFWNEYYAYIRIDENYNMKDFILSTSIAKDKS